ncbi:MAG: hypothetical protein JOY55_17070 [Mycobacterium sp.]|nr:hypothetical protein [Mycobacterium sp.]
MTISGNGLVLGRALTAADDGPHQWSVAATQNGVTVSGSIPVQVNATPTGVTFTPSAVSLPDNAAAGTTVAAVSVSMSDGSAFAGTLTTSPASVVTMSGNNLVLTRGLTSADDGSQTWTVAATQNGVTVSGSIQVQVNAASPTPTGVTFTPTVASLPDNAAAGTMVAAVSVSMSDGSAFTGNLAASPAGIVTMSGNNLVLARALNSADDGSQTWIVTATENGVTVSSSIVVKVTAVKPAAAITVDGSGNATVSPGASITVAVANGPGTTTDWIGLSVTGSADTAFLSWDYLNGTQTAPASGLTSASIQMTAPATAGSYEARFYFNDGYTVLARTPFTVAAAAPPPPPATPLWSHDTFDGAGHYAIWKTYIANPSPPTVLSAYPVTGSITVDGFFFFVTPANGSVVAQWTLNGAPISPYMTGPSFAFTIDTTQYPDGTYVLGMRWIECNSPGITAAQLVNLPFQIVILNHGTNTGAQTVPLIDSGYNLLLVSDGIDFIKYPGTPQHNNAYPYPTPTFMPPSGDPSLRSETNWFHEAISEPNCGEYYNNPQLYTTTQGGVVGLGFTPETGITVAEAYPGVSLHNYMDGGRDDNMVSPYANFVEAPVNSPWVDSNGHPIWVGCDLGGRVFTLDHTGTAATIAGVKRDRSQLPLEYGNDAQVKSTQIFVGTIGTPSFGDIGNANDLCFDPRNPLILYVTKVLDCCIVKIDFTSSLTNPTITRYAGQDGTPGYQDGRATEAVSGAAPVALFNQPFSIVMANGVNPPDVPAGTMYVTDNLNSCIRVISPDGSTVSTLCGKAPPNDIPISTIIGGVSTTVATSTFSSDASPNVLHLVSASGVQIGMGAIDQDNPANLTGLNNVITAINGNDVTMSDPVTGGGVIAGDNVVFNVLRTYSPFTPVSFADAVIPLPMGMRFTSQGLIVYFELATGIVRGINPSPGHTINGQAPQTVFCVGAFGNRPTPAGATNWSWLAVDTAGACGPVDDIVCFTADTGTIGNAETTSRLSLDGTYFSDWTQPGLLMPEGIPPNDFGDFGHYPWAVAFSKTQARMITSGFGTLTVKQWRPLQPSDPPCDTVNSINIDYNRYINGMAIWLTGCQAYLYPYGMRPSFQCLAGQSGNPHFGSSIVPTFDDLVGPGGRFPNTTTGDAGLAEYIQAGFGGSVPRPEITGNDLRDLIYYIRRCQWISGQAPVIVPGPDSTDTTPPVISNIVGTRTGPTSANFTFTTSKPCWCIVGAGKDLSYPTYAAEPYLGPPNANSYTTSHNINISGFTTANPCNFAIQVKDMAGNISVTPNISLGYTPSPDGTIIIGETGGQLVNGYGTWSWAGPVAPAPVWSNNRFFNITLNGKPVVSYTGSALDVIGAERMEVNYGGQLFALSHDEIWHAWTGYTWVVISSPSLVDPSTLGAPLPAPPLYTPPYTPSTDGSTLASGAAGTLMTADGSWSFGAVNGSGWQIELNGTSLGILMAQWPNPGYLQADQLEVDGGQLFYHDTQLSAWRIWEGNFGQSVTGPTALPVPVGSTFSPAMPSLSATSAPGTLVTTITVTTSDGSAFSGVLTVTNFDGTAESAIVLSGSTLVMGSGGTAGDYGLMVTATQNGCSFKAGFVAILT